jgi:hypothetical protein
LGGYGPVTALPQVVAGTRPQKASIYFCMQTLSAALLCRKHCAQTAGSAL